MKQKRERIGGAPMPLGASTPNLKGGQDTYVSAKDLKKKKKKPTTRMKTQNFRP